MSMHVFMTITPCGVATSLSSPFDPTYHYKQARSMRQQWGASKGSLRE
jgi:hypothetical protein